MTHLLKAHGASTVTVSAIPYATKFSAHADGHHEVQRDMALRHYVSAWPRTRRHLTMNATPGMYLGATPWRRCPPRIGYMIPSRGSSTLHNPQLHRRCTAPSRRRRPSTRTRTSPVKGTLLSNMKIGGLPGEAKIPEGPLRPRLALREPPVGAGRPASGAPQHFHNTAWNACVYGAKKWLVYPARLCVDVGRTDPKMGRERPL